MRRIELHERPHAGHHRVEKVLALPEGRFPDRAGAAEDRRAPLLMDGVVDRRLPARKIR
jgi:hypothetical protein